MVLTYARGTTQKYKNEQIEKVKVSHKLKLIK